jgi:hypothetical protein
MSSPVIDSFGNKLWYDSKGDLHREDGHAAEWQNGTKEWWVNGFRHREDGPAVEYSNGSKEWYLNNKLHREDGPAIDHSDGTQKWWYLNGEIVYSDSENNTDQFELSQEMKKSIIKYKLFTSCKNE